ncbi:hypothetical protein [Pseudomonas aeruginosa]|uniref:hypothetical protein n=1 Tax=Pseudomonas aeruginosa TaxID=287 RepID=UPI000D7754AD
MPVRHGRGEMRGRRAISRHPSEPTSRNPHAGGRPVHSVSSPSHEPPKPPPGKPCCPDW